MVIKKDIEGDLLVLETTDDDKTRNDIAIALSEQKAREVVPVLLRLIQRKDLQNKRGTIVHCLGNFDLSDKADLLINLIIEGNWEVANESFDLVRKIDTISSETWKAGVSQVLTALSSKQPEWRRELLNDLIEV